MMIKRDNGMTVENDFGPMTEAIRDTTAMEQGAMVDRLNLTCYGYCSGTFSQDDYPNLGDWDKAMVPHLGQDKTNVRNLRSISKRMEGVYLFLLSQDLNGEQIFSYSQGTWEILLSPEDAIKARTLKESKDFHVWQSDDDDSDSPLVYLYVRTTIGKGWNALKGKDWIDRMHRATLPKAKARNKVKAPEDPNYVTLPIVITKADFLTFSMLPENSKGRVAKALCKVIQEMASKHADLLDDFLSHGFGGVKEVISKGDNPPKASTMPQIIAKDKAKDGKRLINRLITKTDKARKARAKARASK